VKFRWNLWNLDHIDAHGIQSGEAEELVRTATRPYPENIGQGKWAVRGKTTSGRFLQVIYIEDPDDTLYVIHARALTPEAALKAEETMSAIQKKKSTFANTSFHDLTDAEKTEAVKKYDEEFSLDKYFRDPTPEECAHWEQIRRRLKVTNPTGQYHSVKALLPLDMIKDLEKLAKERKVSRSKMIAIAVGIYLARQREK
jgi:hypothetical protein